MQQVVRFDVWDYDSSTSSDFIGSVETSISKIIGSKSSTLVLNLLDKGNKFLKIFDKNLEKNTGKIILRGEKVAMNNDLLHF